MTITEFIAALEEIRSAEGDIPVWTHTFARDGVGPEEEAILRVEDGWESPSESWSSIPRRVMVSWRGY